MVSAEVELIFFTATGMGLCFGFAVVEWSLHRVKASSAFPGMAEHLPIKVMNELFPWFPLLARAAFALPI